VFELGPRPGDDWGKRTENRPVSSINEHLITPLPFLSARNKTFKKRMKFHLGHINDKANIYYSFNTRNPGPGNSILYTDSVTVKSSSKVYFKAYVEGKEPSNTVNSQFFKLKHDYKISVKNGYSPQYAAGGDLALVDMIRGGRDFRTGAWQGYHGVDMEVMIDLGKVKSINSISVTFLEDQNSWIFMPEVVTIEVSKRQYDFKTVGIISNPLPERSDEPIIHEFSRSNLRTNGRYVKIKAQNRGICPPWHKGAGGKAWIFVDEVTIN
jgi:hypothetical protein